jgi:prepilin-type N-terminal cleavage/methylation domain-containing protein
VRAERGFTLVEVLVVTVVLALGITGFLQATLVAARLGARGRGLTAAVFLAQDRLERIGALGWERVTAGLERGEEPDLAGAAGPGPRERVDLGALSFLLLYERDVLPGAPPRCTVRCYWSERGRPFSRGDGVCFAVSGR